MPKKPFDEILSEINKKKRSSQNDEELLERFPLSDAMDKEILMHREVHFGGKFDLMLDYYYASSKGVHPEFEIKRIEELKLIEETAGENLAPLLLSGADSEKIGRAKDAYKKLREIYEGPSSKSTIPRLIADLILSEEEEADTEIQAILAEGKKMIPFLLDLLRSEDFHDPLFPGYGQAPFLAARALGLIGEEKAIISLFENIGRGDFENEKMVLGALKNVGDNARDFLLRIVQKEPFGEMNERAALALIEFQGDPRVAETCLSLLENPAVFEEGSLAAYLILVCEGIKDPLLRQRFSALEAQDHIPAHLKKDMQAIIGSWS